MASTFTTHYKRCLPRLEAREKRQKTQRIALHADQLTTLVAQLDPQERKQLDADLAVFLHEHAAAEHVAFYNQMVAEHQNAFRAQVQAARDARTY
ncbi:hypothetical protein [Dictyobacter arantiisoli]|uniref:Uncharacterized protein n=1 Tax=Dictyobacter arantiisoli TaxID=2014874 RepID=A0A5A5TJJ1_9CHLR|nr:hypothetical protein [Dictyobacter arantiisoli]GCF11781.1 hypothetical protein KDI_53450 [Dictyobacter arantiisoli]